jgi:AraC-like DNA-binding protein
VALAADFADLSHFSRMFKGAFVIPARYRTLEICAIASGG